ncbi:hypothetical protein BDW75DRAFT_245439 [Aspergillus navahoensis]
MSGTAYSSNAGDRAMHELSAYASCTHGPCGWRTRRDGGHHVRDERRQRHHSVRDTDTPNDLLKAEFGFPGKLMPDVGGQKSSFGSANAGLDYGSGQYWSESIIEAGLRNGSLTEARFDDIADSNIIGSFYVGLDENPAPSVADTTANRHVMTNNKQLIRGIAAESLVLLKNTPGDNFPLPRATLSPSSARMWAFHSLDRTLSSVSWDEIAIPSRAISLPPLVLVQALRRDGMLWWITNDTFTESSSSGISGGSMDGAPGGGNSPGGGLPGGGFGGGDSRRVALKPLVVVLPGEEAAAAAA